MYVLCFRMRPMMEVLHLKSQLLHMPLEPILQHPLDPLKVCLPSIVGEFLRQAKAACLFTTSESFLFNDLLDSDLSRAFGGVERLDKFFPFDPFLLKKCDRFVCSSFVYWSMVRTTYDDEEEGNSDEDAGKDFVNGNEDHIADDAMAKSFDEEFDLDEFEYSRNKMSITPKNSSSKGLAGYLQAPMRMSPRIQPSTSPESL